MILTIVIICGCFISRKKIIQYHRGMEWSLNTFSLERPKVVMSVGTMP